MYKCKVCGKEFQKLTFLSRHVSFSYTRENIKEHCLWLVYLVKYENRYDLSKESLENMYINEKKSSDIMCNELKVTKKNLLLVMRYYGIKMRKTASEKTINQIARDGVWNKGQTKYTNLSVKKYSESRRGKNNPYFTAPGFKERHIKNKERLQKMQNRANGNRNPKTTEFRMCKILNKYGICYLRNFSLKYKTTWRLYDFLIFGNLVIEMQGNYYHANPLMYSPEDWIRIRNSSRKAKDIWIYDEEKKELALQQGYIYKSIWEDVFTNMLDEEVVFWIKSGIK